MRHWLRRDGGIVEKHCAGRRRCDLSEYLIRLVPIGASLIYCKQAEFLGVHSKEFTELAAGIRPGSGGVVPPPPPTRVFSPYTSSSPLFSPTTHIPVVISTPTSGTLD